MTDPKNNTQTNPNAWFQWRSFLTGLLMGAADLVPGISGGTVALLGGIYGRLLGAISRVDMTFLKLLLTGKIAQAWTYVDATFLANLGLGIATALLLFAKLITWLLVVQPLLMWSLFLGLIAVASWLLVVELQKNQQLHLAWLLLGVVVSIALSRLPLAHQSLELSGWVYLGLMAAGSLAICAMILPGVSGSFILLLLGVYPFLISRLAVLDVTVIAVFALGCVIGLLVFSRLISYLLRCHTGTVMSLLAGLMMGSAAKLWPWKQTVTYRLSSSGAEVPLQQENLLPWTYSQLTGLDSQLVWCLLVIIVAGFLVAKFGRIKLQDVAG